MNNESSYYSQKDIIRIVKLLKGISLSDGINTAQKKISIDLTKLKVTWPKEMLDDLNKIQWDKE